MLAVWRNTILLVVSGAVVVTAYGSAKHQVENALKSDTGKVLSELDTAEHMMEKELNGHPQILQEEMQLLHQAEDAVRHRTRAAARAPAGLIQQKGTESAAIASGAVLGKLDTVESMVKKVLSGHPKELKAEEQALHQAESAAQALGSPRAGALMEMSKTQAESLQGLHMSSEQMQQQRSRSMAAALQEERSYGKAEHQLSKDGEKILSEFGSAEDSVAQAFAGKDSKAVKTAMQVGELLEKARDEQQRVTSMNVAEAAKSDKKANALASAFAQTAAESKAAQEQRTYIAGMSSLAKDEKAALSDFIGLKTAVARAFAGQDSKAVEKAMEVGELLDRAREDQQQVAQKDEKAAADAPPPPPPAPKLAKHAPHHLEKKVFLQSQGRASAKSSAMHALRMQSLAAKQVGILHMTEHAEEEAAQSVNPVRFEEEEEEGSGKGKGKGGGKGKGKGGGKGKGKGGGQGKGKGAG